MEAIRVLNERQPPRDVRAQAARLPEEQSAPLSSIEMLEELTLTLLKEITLLKDIRKFHAESDGQRLSLPEEVRRFEIEIIRRTLLRTKGHQARAAQLLGLSATTLNAKLKRYGIDPNVPLEPDTPAPSLDDTVEGGSANDEVRRRA